jgi:hypothetical protein
MDDRVEIFTLIGRGLVRISEIVIWPLTLIFLLKMFNIEIREKLKQLRNLEVSSEGVKGNFGPLLETITQGVITEAVENGSQQRKKMAEPVGRGIRDSKDVILKPGLINSKLMPYEQLFSINTKLEDYLKALAKNNNLSIDDFESLTMIKKLVEKNKLDLNKAKKLENIVNIVRAASPNISKDQINIIRTYYENI